MAMKHKVVIQGGAGEGYQNSSSRKETKRRLVLKKSKVDEVIIALDTENAAKAIGVSAAMMKKMRSEGSGPMYSMVGTKCVYLIRSLESFLIKNTAHEK